MRLAIVLAACGGEVQIVAIPDTSIVLRAGLVIGTVRGGQHVAFAPERRLR